MAARLHAHESQKNKIPTKTKRNQLLKLAAVCESGEFGPSLMDIRRQLRPEGCPEDGIPQTWRHGNGRARSIAPAMPPSLKDAAWDLKTFEAPQAPANKDGTMPYVGSQSEGCGASLNRADLRTPPLPRRPYRINGHTPVHKRLARLKSSNSKPCTQTLSNSQLGHSLHGLRSCWLRIPFSGAAKVPKGPQAAQHFADAGLSRRPVDGGKGQLWHWAALPAGLCRMLGPDRQQAAAASPALAIQHQGVQSKCCRPSRLAAGLPGKLLGPGGAAGRRAAAGAAPRARHPTVV